MSLEILEYLRGNGETKQEVLRTTICRNHDVLSKRLVSLEGLGLIACDHRMCDESRHRANYWTLTEIGSAAAGMLEAVDLVILGRLDMGSGAVREILMIVEKTPPHRDSPRRHPPRQGARGFGRALRRPEGGTHPTMVTHCVHMYLPASQITTLGRHS